MRVIVPATVDGLRLETMRALLDHAPQFGDRYGITVVPMRYEEAYFDLLARLWDDGESFVIVEHDIVIDGQVILGFCSCEQLWCAHSYEVFAGDIATAYGGAYGLGCAKFSAALLAALPDAIVRAGEMRIDGTGTWAPRSYGVMDATLTQTLRQNGYDVHQHFPNVEHLHVYDRRNIPDAAWPAGARHWAGA